MWSFKWRHCDGRHEHRQTWWSDSKGSSFTRSWQRTTRYIGAHHKQSGRRATWIEAECKKMKELVGEQGWINKTVPSASLGPAGRIKWVDKSGWVSFLLSSLPFFSFVFLLHMANSTSSPPSPCCTHSIEMVSHPHTTPCLPTQASTSPEPFLIYGSITNNHPPGQMSSSSSALSCTQILFKIIVRKFLLSIWITMKCVAKVRYIPT